MASLFLPDLLREMLAAGMDVAMSVSGGKDSQTMLLTVVPWFRAQGFSGKLYALHTTLGRAERAETASFLEALCAKIAIPLIVVQPVVGGVVGDLQDALARRKGQLANTATPFWPSMRNRYCTALKRTACDKQMSTSSLIVSLEGIRAAESEPRAEKQPFSVRTTITGQRYKRLIPEAAWSLYQADQARLAHLPIQHSFFEQEDAHIQLPALPRLAFTLYPLFFWDEEEVWRSCGTSLAELEERRMLYRQGIEQEDPTLRAQALAGWPAHPAYVKLARRLSCSLCIWADEMTLRSGAYNSPDYFRQLVWWEIETGYPFQQGRWLADVAPKLLTDEQREALSALPQRQNLLKANKRTWWLATR